MIDEIMKGGPAVFVEDQKLPIRRFGQLGYAYVSRWRHLNC